MLRKLYKHEFIGLYRLLLPLYGLLLALALVVKIFSFFDFDNPVVSTTFTFITSLTGIMAIGLMFASFVLVIINFYKSLLGKQGYLTFSLPIKPIDHIVCKLVCGVVTSITTVLAEIAGLFIIFGDKEFFKSVFYYTRELFVGLNEAVGTGKTVLICVEVVICALLYICSGFLMFFASMSIGQRFRNKILGSIISYFCIYAIVETVMMTVILIATQFISLEDMMNSINSVFVISQCYVAFMLVVYLAQAIPYFIITNHFLSKKLNLE